MVDIPADAGVGVSRDKLASMDEDVAKLLWLESLLSEYRLLQLYKYGVSPVVVNVKYGSSEAKSSDEVDVDELYRAIYEQRKHALKRRVSKDEEAEYMFDDVEMMGREKKIVDSVKKAYVFKEPLYFYEASKLLKDELGSEDKYVAITPYTPVVTELNISPEDLAHVDRLATKLLSTLAPLGSRVEAELRKLIFSGYRSGIAETIDGIGEEERKFIEELLDKPFDRVALIKAYGKVADVKKLIFKILSEIYSWKTAKPEIMRRKIPVLTSIMY